MITRLDGVSCAICMEPLFCKRDDLDELCAIATPDCGHVFHEDCIRKWFTSQSNTYYANQREIRGLSVDDISDAPAECPTCRTECFADEDTGEPLIHRLFINFEGNGFEGSSQMGSSPARTPWKRSKGREEEVMGLARRAKGISEEVKDLTEQGEVREEDFEAVMKRAGGLEGDLVSQKAVDGIKRYVGGLTAALNNLRSTIIEHPLVPTLRAEAAAAKAAEATARREMKRLIETHMPQEIQRAIQVEQDRCRREVKKVKEQMEVVKRELEREGVLRRTARKEMEERFRAEEKKAADAVSMMKKEKIERETLSATLADRMRQLRAFQAKAESRKATKAQVAELEAENAELRAKLKSASTPRQTVTRPLPTSQRTADDDDDMDIYADDHGDADFASPSGRSEQKPAILTAAQIVKRRLSGEYDESLEVEFPSFAGSSSRPPTKIGRSGRAHPTARTVEYDMAKAGGPIKRPHQSKYFASAAKTDRHSSPIDEYPGLFSDGDDDDSLNMVASPAKRSRTNPFVSSRSETDRKKTLAPVGLAKSGRRTPPPAPQPIEIDSSPEDKLKPLRPSQVNGQFGLTKAGTSKPRGVAVQGRSPLRKQPSMVEFLGIADKNGRPNKGLALGVKVRRKA